MTVAGNSTPWARPHAAIAPFRRVAAHTFVSVWLPGSRPTLSTLTAGKPHDFSGFTMSVYKLRPTSRGTVNIKLADPDNPPAMQPHYLSTDHDGVVSVAALRVLQKLVATQAMAPYIELEYLPGPSCSPTPSFWNLSAAML